MTDRIIPTPSYPSLNAALTAAVNGDRIIFNSGTSYSGEVLHSFGSKINIEIRNQTGSEVSISLDGGSYIALGAGWSFSSATAHKLNFSGGTTGAALLRAYNVVTGLIEDATFTKSSGGLAAQIDASSSTAGMTLNRVELYAQAGQTNPTSTSCMMVRGNGRTATLTADNCLFENGAAGIYAIDGGSARGGTITVRRSIFKNLDYSINYSGLQSGGLDARFNLLYATNAYGKYGFNYNLSAGYTPTTLFYRNTIDVTTKAIKYTAGDSNSNAAIKGNWGASIDTITGADQTDNSTTGTPGFTDQGNNDYSLLASSILIDIGFDTGDETDYAGESTPSGDAADIGAYEYQQPAWLYGESPETEKDILIDFIINRVDNIGNNYNKNIPQIPYGYLVKSPYRPHKRSTPYTLTSK